MLTQVTLRFYMECEFTSVMDGAHENTAHARLNRTGKAATISFVKLVGIKKPEQNGRGLRGIAHNATNRLCARHAPPRAAGSSLCLWARVGGLCALFFCALALVFAQEREGNFHIRFEPTADLQTGAPIPFRITVNDADHKPLINAKVTLQIETMDHTHVKVFGAPAEDTRADPGIYISKPVFDAAGEWSVYVEVHRQNGRWDEMSARTIQYTVPQ